MARGYELVTESGEKIPKLQLDTEDRVQLENDLKLWSDLVADGDQFNLIIRGERIEALRRLLTVLRAVV